jgi:hypothetical protein
MAHRGSSAQLGEPRSPAIRLAELVAQIGQTYRFSSQSPIISLLNGQNAVVLKLLSKEDGRASYFIRFESGRQEVAFEDELIAFGLAESDH